MKNLIVCLLCLIVGTEMCASSAKGDSLRILSYNVHNGIGMDGKVDYARIAHVISDVHPDVVALQELDSVTHRSPANVLEEIARGVGMNYVFGPAISYGGGKYGIGILSKEQPLSVRNVALPGREEARTLLVVEFEKYIFLATHFSLTAEDQVKSVEIIWQEAASKGKPVFMAGDMNSVPSSLTQKRIRKHFKVLTDDRWSTCNGECIDYIYGYKGKNGKFTVRQKGMIEDYVASDHCPVYVDVYYGCSPKSRPTDTRCHRPSGNQFAGRGKVQQTEESPVCLLPFSLPMRFQPLQHAFLLPAVMDNIDYQS